MTEEKPWSEMTPEERYKKLSRTLKKGQLYNPQTGEPLNQEEVEEALKQYEHPEPNTVAFMVPEPMRPIFDAIQLQVKAKQEGNTKLEEEVRQRLREWLIEHPDIWARYAEELKRTGFKMTAEKCAKARELAKPIGPVGKVLRYFKGIAEAVLNRREP